ncbi:hypothetical protein LZL87_004409 [Fusarium oxysporum]|nr:hypothetical protein LZL87_004409 [Fusarium oxysporum]
MTNPTFTDKAKQAGQICMSTERIIVHESISSEFQDLLGHAIRKNFGTARDTPAVVTSASASHNRDLISDAISKGAYQIKIFGDEHAHDTETKIRPVVLGNVKKEHGYILTRVIWPQCIPFHISNGTCSARFGKRHGIRLDCFDFLQGFEGSF